MTNPPGEGQPPHDPNDPERNQDQPGYWQQQSQQQPYQQNQYGQQPYGQQPGYGQMPVQFAPDHPKATTALVLGILGVVLCQVLAPFAWSIGKKTVAEIDASRGAVGGRGSAQAGYVLGIVGTVLLGLVILYLIGVIAVLAISAGTAMTSYSG